MISGKTQPRANVTLLFFAGHGIAIDQVNYLLPTDADPSSATTPAATAMR
jgi:uncharacterized caspase-like protein